MGGLDGNLYFCPFKTIKKWEKETEEHVKVRSLKDQTVIFDQRKRTSKKLKNSLID